MYVALCGTVCGTQSLHPIISYYYYYYRDSTLMEIYLYVDVRAWYVCVCVHFVEMKTKSSLKQNW